MKIYNLSKDFEIFWNLIQAGADVIIFHDEIEPVNKTMMIFNKSMLAGRDKEKIKSLFEKTNVEFVMPHLPVVRSPYKADNGFLIKNLDLSLVNFIKQYQEKYNDTLLAIENEFYKALK